MWCGQKCAVFCAGIGADLRRKTAHFAPPAHFALPAHFFDGETADVIKGVYALNVIRGGDSIFAATQDDRAGLCHIEDYCAPR